MCLLGCVLWLPGVLYGTVEKDTPVFSWQLGSHGSSPLLTVVDLISWLSDCPFTFPQACFSLPARCFSAGSEFSRAKWTDRQNWKSVVLTEVHGTMPRLQWPVNVGFPLHQPCLQPLELVVYCPVVGVFFQGADCPPGCYSCSSGARRNNMSEPQVTVLQLTEFGNFEFNFSKLNSCFLLCEAVLSLFAFKVSF